MGRGRAPCCAKVGLNKGAWTPEEDSRLVAYINKHGHGNWRALPKLAGLLRCGKSCRLRWINYLSPNIKRGNFTKEEEDTIFRLHKLLGNKWSKIAACLPGRTDNEIKNVWNTHLKKRLRQEEPKPEDSSQSSSSSTCSSSSAADLSCNSDNGESRRSELSETTLSDDLSLEALDPEIWDAAAFLETEDPLAQLEEEAQGRSQWVEYLEKELGLCESNQLEKSHHYHYQARDAELVGEEDPVSSYFLGDLNSVADLLDDVDLRVF